MSKAVIAFVLVSQLQPDLNWNICAAPQTTDRRQKPKGPGDSSEDDFGDESLECEGNGGDEWADGSDCTSTMTWERDASVARLQLASKQQPWKSKPLLVGHARYPLQGYGRIICAIFLLDEEPLKVGAHLTLYLVHLH
jgi:hypothetical protein